MNHTRSLGLAAAVAAGLLAWSTSQAAAVLGAETASPFAGRWIGDFTTSTGAEGEADWSISSTGRLQGTVYSSTFDLTASLVGQFGADGAVRLVGMPPLIGADGEPHVGTAAIDAAGRLLVATRNRATDQRALAVLVRAD